MTVTGPARQYSNGRESVEAEFMTRLWEEERERSENRHRFHLFLNSVFKPKQKMSILDSRICAPSRDDTRNTVYREASFLKESMVDLSFTSISTYRLPTHSPAITHYPEANHPGTSTALLVPCLTISSSLQARIESSFPEVKQTSDPLETSLPLSVVL